MEHILFEFHFQAGLVCRGLLVAGTVTGKEIDSSVIVNKDAGIKLPDLVRTGTKDLAVCAADKIHKLIGPFRPIRNGNADLLQKIETVVKIILSIIAAADIGRPKSMCAIGITGILGLFENDAFIAPIGKIVCGRGPTDIVILAVDIAVKFIVTAVYIQAISKDAGFAIGNIFPTGKIGVKNLFFIFISPLFSF